MKKIISLVIVCILLVTGCDNADKKISSRLYSYDKTTWNNLDTDKDKEKIVEEIMSVWEKYDELYTCNCLVTVSMVKTNLDEYIDNNSDENINIFLKACEIVGIDCKSYKKID